ncbi:predicted protein [Chaetomium globosum CBS 148.51]|uniref:Uncharacterized protein n=1 Tax=Chaetomium globosum (strain ATCC 6205 / CBS 148.51 / DSM 1962 / NBRC 6347 / NRRL 1970) TaxID=306901 RepID=Q2GW41_CHAGB|nr:uncharacterized protein CHGG_07813 [Chaetomium globosum CBS 148.51]EAQ86560.1 predicted protein [Chaetomium globosum CBS 148.51]
MPPQPTPAARPAQTSGPAKSTSTATTKTTSTPAASKSSGTPAATKTTPAPATTKTTPAPATTKTTSTTGTSKTTSTPAANKTSQAPASTSTSGQSAPAAASTAAPTQEDLKFDKEQTRKEALMQAHWLQWSASAETERSYVIVFDQSSAPVTAELKRMTPGAKPAAVPQVRGFFDFLSSTKLGDVQVATVDAATYGQLMDKFDFKRITVKVNKENRTGFIPIARATNTSEGTPAQAAPAATGDSNASGTSTGATKTSNTSTGATKTGGANTGSGNATKGASAGTSNATKTAASSAGTGGATKGNGAGGAATKGTSAASSTTKTSGTAVKGKGTDRS